MPEVNGLSELLKQHGPMGFALIAMVAGLVYLLRWLRSEQDRAAAERKEAHEKFAESLEKLGARHEAITRETIQQLTVALDKHGDRMDRIEDLLRSAR